MAYVTYNEQELQHLRRLATSGDDTAQSMLYNEARRVSKAVNQRLLRLERADKDEISSAYQNAIIFTEDKFGAKRFRVNKRQSVDELVRILQEGRHFMSQESSTVRGMKIAKKRMFDTLDAYGIHIETSQQEKFYEFVHSDSVQDVIDYIGEYDTVMDIIALNVSKSRDSFKMLKREFDNFLIGRGNFDEFIDRFSGGMTFEEMRSRHYEREIPTSHYRRRFN